jgi:peptidoglycan-N-acetylglucosamine deacetylase
MRRRAFLGQAAFASGSMLVAGAATGEIEQSARASERRRWQSSVSEGLSTESLRICWSADQSVGLRAALTFDDGPTLQFTPGVLDVLAKVGVHATFFVIGALVEKHPDLVRRAVDAGHEIGNHTYDHHSAATLSAQDVRTGVLRGSDSIEKVLGVRPRWLRPPRGEITTATLLAAREANLKVALWSVNRGDGPDADSRAVGRHLASALQPGAVAGLHDGIGRSSWVGSPDHTLLTRRQAEVQALPAAISGWLAHGYRFDSLSDLIP